MYCDILIVGCGPAGSSAASEAAKTGLNVVIIEKKQSIGEPVQCAEFISKPLLREINITKNSVVQETKSIKLHLTDNSIFEFNSPGYMLNRSRFDKELAADAINNGAKLMLNSTFIGMEGEKVLVRTERKSLEIIPKVVIGADGPSSTVGRLIKYKNKDFLIGIQYETPLIAPMDSLEIYFRSEFFGGYGWLFPKGMLANVGVGIKNLQTFKGYSIRELLNNFSYTLEREGKIKNMPLSITFGLIPAGGHLEKTVYRNVMLVGDAAGQTHPITGSGIPQAIICGKIAGNVAVEAIKASKLEILEKYETKWKKIFSHQLEIATKRRVLLESNWRDLDSTIRKCWPTFKEYYD